mmetsp:Transcript_4781/g.7970  ORF Transcript_4781/g.7970 Transcript_4781/m.7970 type:complete len:82 (+) Transcript_4781:362-607(+)
MLLRTNQVPRLGDTLLIPHRDEYSSTYILYGHEEQDFFGPRICEEQSTTHPHLFATPHHGNAIFLRLEAPARGEKYAHHLP